MTEVSERRLRAELPCYYDLYLPAAEKPKPLLIALHGYGGDKASMMRLARRINDQDFVIASLQGPHQHLVMPTKESPQLGYGFGWLTNFKPEESIRLHHRLLDVIIDELTQAGAVDAQRVFLFGFSQAVGVNFRYAFTHAQRVRGVVAVCGGIPGDWATEGKYAGANLDVLYIAAERDEFYTPERMRQNAEALRTRAHTVELQFFDAAHEVPRAAYPVINDWLQRRLSD